MSEPIDAGAVVSMNILARLDQEVAPISQDIVRQIADDIGKEVASHIETMYPKAVEGAGKNMLVSVRGCVVNNIMAALETTDEQEILQRLADRKKFRRQSRAHQKRMMETPGPYQTVDQPPPHPDAELLAVCAQLRVMQDEWQRLWTLTSDEWTGMDDPPITEADHAWWDYNNHVWPGVYISASELNKRDPNDLPSRLHDFHPVTQEGLRAKAAAVVALDDAASYGDLRDDGWMLNLSLIRDAAGDAVRPLGEDAPT